MKQANHNMGLSWTTLLAGSLIVLAGFAAYSNSFRGLFVYDDLDSIPNNTTIRHLWPLGTVLSPPADGRTVGGRPILNLSFAINYTLGGTNVWGYHATNLAIHLCNGLLLLGILRRTFLLPTLRPKFGQSALFLSSAIALLWVVHPLTTEAVTYTVQRAESLASMFYLLVLYAVIRGSQSRQAILWYVGAVIACWLGIATKEITISIPVMVLLYDRTLLAGSFRQAWQQRGKLYLGLTASWIWAIVLIVRTGLLTKTYAGKMGAPDPWSYACSQPGVIFYYLRLVVWPHPLCLDRAWQVARNWSAIGLPMLVVGSLLAATIWALLRSDVIIRAGGLLGAWFFLILAPSSSIVPLVDFAYEHRMYLPLAAVVTWVVLAGYLLGQRWLARKRLAIGLSLVGMAAIALGVVTFERNSEYHDELLLLADSAKWDPYNPRVHNDWGYVLLKVGRLSEAMEQFKQAMRLNPNLIEARNNMGNALSILGRPTEALAYYEQTLQLNPHLAETHNNMGNTLSIMGHPAEAIEHYKQTLRLNPNYVDAHYNWAKALLTLGQPAEAIEHCEQAVRLKPNYAAAHNIWGNACLALGQPSNAVSQYEKALQIDPAYAEAHSNWGIALSQLGRWAEAIEQYRQFLRVMPDSAPVHFNLALALAHMGRLDEAIEQGRKAEQLARAAGQNSLAEEIDRRLQLYRDQKPYRVQ